MTMLTIHMGIQITITSILSALAETAVVLPIIHISGYNHQFIEGA